MSKFKENDKIIIIKDDLIDISYNATIEKIVDDTIDNCLYSVTFEKQTINPLSRTNMLQFCIENFYENDLHEYIDLYDKVKIKSGNYKGLYGHVMSNPEYLGTRIYTIVVVKEFLSNEELENYMQNCDKIIGMKKLSIKDLEKVN